MNKLRLVLTLAAMVSAGCSENTYEIELRAKGDSLERDLTCWRHAAGAPERPENFGPADLRTLATIYGVDAPASFPRKYTFRGTFRERTPQDIGGSGQFTRVTSPLGEFSIYCERFRGSENLAGDLDNRRKQLNFVVDALAAWFDAELADDPVRPKLRRFVDETLRNDLNNLLLIIWAHNYAMPYRADGAPEPLFGELLARVGQFLVDRNYIRADELPQLFRALENLSAGNDPVAARAMVMRVLSRKIVTAPGESFEGVANLLADVPRVKRTLAKQLIGTAAYLRRLEKMRERNPTPSEEIDIAISVVGESISDALFPTGRFDLFSPHDHVRLKFHCDAAPLATNGAWDAQQRVVGWNTPLDTDDEDRPAPPVVLFATWTTPDVAAQQARFGRVALAGGALARFALWYRGLTDPERAEWDKFARSLSPGEGLVERIRSFRFAGDEAQREGDRASVAR